MTDQVFEWNAMPLIVQPQIGTTETAPDLAADDYWNQASLVYSSALSALYLLRKPDPATGISKYQFSFDTTSPAYQSSFSAVYLPCSSLVAIYQVGETMPNGVIADSLTIHVQPIATVRKEWSEFGPAMIPPLTDLYYSRIDDTTVRDYLRNAISNEIIGSPLGDALAATYGSMYPTAADDTEVIINALMDRELEFIAFYFLWQIAEMGQDTADPTRLRLDVMFSCGDPHSDENVQNFFQYYQRLHSGYGPVGGEAVVNYHLTGHPMIMSILAEPQIDTNLYVTDADMEAQTQSTALLLLGAARVDVMDRTVLPERNRTKFDTNTIFLDPDSMPPTVRVQAQISPIARANVEAVFPQQYVPNNGGGTGSNFDNVLSPAPTLGWEAAVHGEALVYIYNPDGISLFFNALDSNGGPATDYLMIPVTTSNITTLSVTSLVETGGEGLIEVRRDSTTGPLLFTIEVLILQFRALPARFFQAQNTVNGAVQHAGNIAGEIDFFDTINFLLGKQANIFIIPAVDAAPVTDPLHRVLDMPTAAPLDVPLTLIAKKPDPSDPDMVIPAMCAILNDLNFDVLPGGPSVKINGVYVWEFDYDPNDKEEILGLSTEWSWWGDYCAPVPDPNEDRVVVFIQSLNGIGADSVPYTGAHEMTHALHGLYLTSTDDEIKYVDHTHADAKGLDTYFTENLMYADKGYAGFEKKRRLTARQAKILNNLLTGEYSWGS